MALGRLLVSLALSRLKWQPPIAVRPEATNSMTSKPKYWLLKSEPESYSISDLERDHTTLWEGVRNFTARNLMRDHMSKGDGVLFYHSNAKPPGIAGLAEVSRTGVADPAQFDQGSKYFDPNSDPADPRWVCAEVAFVEEFPQLLPLPLLRETQSLEGMALLRKGQRLSVQPVSAAEWRIVLRMARSLES